MAGNKQGKQAGSGEDDAAEDTGTLYTLPELGARLGKATDDEVQQYVEGYTKAELITEGVKVGTDRIDTDTARLYGKVADFYKHASKEQRAVIMGVSPNMLRVAVAAALRGSRLAEALGEAKNDHGAAREERLTHAETVKAAATAQRKLLRAGLRALAAGNNVWHTAIDSAIRTSDQASTLSSSLEALINVGRRMLKRPTGGMKARLEDSGLTSARLDAAAQLAEDARAAGDAADALTGRGPVTQAELDYWDGINLTLLGNFIEVFEAAHEVDPTVPRLVPIALRGYFRRGRTGAKSAAPNAGNAAAGNSAGGPPPA